MTCEDAAQIVSDTKLTGVFDSIKMECEILPAISGAWKGATLRVHWTWHVTERNSGAPFTLFSNWDVDEVQLHGWEARTFRQILHHQIVDVVRHELDECYEEKGVRVYDPHK